ncbi:IS5 family transposase [Pseudothauera lacus]|uniref:IS5 family transposase n=1 Tax=Pseudothauera lacus TaxID=2136175 RepID=A0A2T4IFA7_9RHOO|nr:IS5 family transposase [Pseudothauera lacus]PTD96470.1 IS5 family transposase [Pseudothauera lacus]
MRGIDRKQQSLFSYISIEDRIAADHPLRRMRRLTDTVLATMSQQFDELYAEAGRPSIPPERLLRALLVQCLFSIRSERALIEHIDFNMMYRWFVGLSMDEPMWDHSTFSANRDRLLKESIMRRFFDGVLIIAEWADLVSDEHFSVDGSLLRAWASHKNMAARDGSDEPPGPDQGRNPEVDFRGKKRSNQTHVSRTDPMALLATKTPGVAYLSYTTHVLGENRNGLVVDVHTTQATGTAEREAALTMLKRSVTRGRKGYAPTVAADRGYDVADFIEQVQQRDILPHVAAKTRDSAVPEDVKATDGYAVSLRRRKMIEESFGWVKEIGMLGRIKLRGLDKIRAHALLNFAAYNLTRINNLVADRAIFPA